MINDKTLNDTKELTNSLLDVVSKSSLAGTLQLYCLAEALGVVVSALYKTKIDPLSFYPKVAELISSYLSHEKQGETND